MSDESAEPANPPSSSTQTGTRSPPARSKSVLSKARAGLKVLGLVVFFTISCICILLTEIIGYPIKWFSPTLYHMWIYLTKKSFCIVLILINAVGMSSRIHVGGQGDIEHLISKDSQSGLLESRFGDRAVVMGNHQLYNDWMFLWWSAYTSNADGGLYIVLKESLKKLPIFGLGMRLYNFIFLARDWSKDEQTMTDAMEVISKQFSDYPAWILIFPEGTVYSREGVKRSKAFAEKTGKSTYNRVLIPRSRGLRFILEHVDDSIEYLYDATVYYSGIPENTYGEEYYTLTNVYFNNIRAKDVYIYWRRWKIKEIPIHDEAKFTQWLEFVWREKDELLGQIAKHPESFSDVSQFPPVDVPVKLRSNLEIFNIYQVLLNLVIIGNLLKVHGYPLVKEFLPSFGRWTSLAILAVTIGVGISTYVYQTKHS